MQIVLNSVAAAVFIFRLKRNAEKREKQISKQFDPLVTVITVDLEKCFNVNQETVNICNQAYIK